MGSKPRKLNIFIQASCILRQLYNSNMAKVSFVKWSQKYTFVAKSPISGIPKDLENAWKADIFETFCFARNGFSCSGNQILRQLLSYYYN